MNRIAGIDLGSEVLVAGFNYSLISRYMNDGCELRSGNEWEKPRRFRFLSGDGERAWSL